jgi:predicted nucleic acid-binding Zn ribbon protein
MKTIKLNSTEIKQRFAQKQADSLALEYLEAKEVQKKANDTEGLRRERILEFSAGASGEDTPKGRVVQGLVYRIGFTNMHSSPAVDIVKLKQLMPAVAAMVSKQVVTTEVDVDMFISLVEKGKVPESIAKQVVQEGNIRGRRILVEAIQ